MAHKRTELRNLVVERLKAAVTVAGDQVYPGRFQPAHEEELYKGGVVFVYTLAEGMPRWLQEGDTSYPASNWNSVVYRDLDLEIHGLVPAFKDDTPDTADYAADALVAVDELAAQIEQALESWEIPGYETAFLRLRQSKCDVTTQDGGMPVARVQLVYFLRYRTTFRPCSDPLVDNESPELELRGLYPGGQIVEGCPAQFEGEKCPIPGEVAVVVESVDVEVPSSL